MRLSVSKRMPSTASLDRLAADNRLRGFGGYKPESSHVVRQADVTGQSYAEQVKRTKEMLRSMTPEKALEVIEFHKGLTFFEALALAKREGSIIVPNFVHDGILTETTDHEYLKQNYPVWTGTSVIYEAPDKKFRDIITFGWDHNKINYSISFKVPEQFRGKANSALVVEHPDFYMVDSGNNKYELKLLEGANIHLIEHFPKKEGWYMPHAETMIPQGEQVIESEKTRNLWRSVNPYLGPLVRGVVVLYRRRLVDADYGHDGAFGVALMPLATAEK